MNINVNFQNSIQIDNEIYIDPYELETNLNKAKYIFITHPHYDHFSLNDIKKVLTKDTKLIIPSICLNDILAANIPKNNIYVVEPEKNYKIDDLSIQTTRAYNINKPYHKRDDNWLGYIIKRNNISYYIVGDSDLINEMNTIKCDVLFVPVGGVYTMDYTTAKKLVEIIKPKIVVPTHYGRIIPSSENNPYLLKESIPSYQVNIYY